MSNGPKSQFKREFTPVLNRVLKSMNDNDMIDMGISLKILERARRIKAKRNSAHWQIYNKE